jgi:Tol biopolymer transport system component
LGELAYMVAVVLIVAIIVGTASYFVTPRAAAYPVPFANVTVNVPTSAPLPYRQLTTGNWNDKSPVWSPNGSLIAYISDRKGLWSVWMMNASGASSEQVSAPGVLAMYPEWSPDSSSVSYWFMDGTTYGYEVVNVNTLRITRVTPVGVSALQGPAQWSPDGSKLLFYAMNATPQLVVADVEEGSLTALANASGSSLLSAWANDTSVLYTSTDNGTAIYMLDLTTGYVSPFLSYPGKDFITPSVDFNGSVAYFSDKLPDIMSTSPYVSYGYGYDLWFRTISNSTATFQFTMAADAYQSLNLIPVPFVPGFMDTAYPPQWNNNATKLLYVCDDPASGERMWIWNLVNWTMAAVPPTTGCNTVDPTWSPDGSMIAFSCDLGGQYHIWLTGLSGLKAVSSTTGY